MLGDKTAIERAKELESYCYRHLRNGKNGPRNNLYRIFYYDCPPLEKKLYHPFLKQQIDYSKTALFTWMNEFIDQLKQKRKFAIRLGRLGQKHEKVSFTIEANAVKALCNGTKLFSQLTEKDFVVSIEQKGVDMKIGLDIASLAYKKQVERIVLISGDSDFVPAAKLARREGIDFILDPLFNHIPPDLSEHVDGIMTCDNMFRPTSVSA